MDLYALLCDIRHNKPNNQIITRIKMNLCNDLVWFNYWPGYYASIKDEFAKKFLSLRDKNSWDGHQERRLSTKDLLKNNI